MYLLISLITSFLEGFWLNCVTLMIFINWQKANPNQALIPNSG
jgi:hypothetical protein